MPKKFRCSLLFSTALLSFSAMAKAQESIAYSYDDLGRLIEARVSGGAHNGLSTGTAYDPAGNRTSFNATCAGGGATPPPPPPPPPPPSPPPPPPPPSGNSPPVTVADTLSVNRCGTGSMDVIANDRDPEGNVPLLLVDAVNANPAKGRASVISSSMIGYEADQGGIAGSDIVTYTVSDSLGATATGTVNITILKTGLCFQVPISNNKQ